MSELQRLKGLLPPEMQSWVFVEAAAGLSKEEEALVMSESRKVHPGGIPNRNRGQRIDCLRSALASRTPATANSASIKVRPVACR